MRDTRDGEAITGQCGGQSLEVVQLIENGQSTASLFARNGNQNFMTRLRDINSHQNGRVLCDTGLGHSRSSLQCGLCKTTVGS